MYPAVLQGELPELVREASSREVQTRPAERCPRPAQPGVTEIFEIAREVPVDLDVDGSRGPPDLACEDAAILRV
jgi:hypothetical protein